MNEFETINGIVQEAIKNSSYHSIVISSCVFIVYTLIVKIIDLFKAKNRNKPIIEMSKAVTEVSNNVIKLNTILDSVFKDNEQKETTKVKSIIQLTFVSFKNEVEHLCREIIIHNNIELNKELITSNISQTVRTEYYKIYSVLSFYSINNKPISTHLKEQWIDEITKDLIDIIYNKQSAQERITQIVNKLSIKINEYNTYIYNKTFND